MHLLNLMKVKVNKFLWMPFFILALFLVACSDDVLDTTDYYFKPVENKSELLPAELSFKSAGGSFEVLFDTGQEWNAYVQNEEDTWVHVSKTEGGSGINSLEITVDPNTSQDDRFAAVIIMAQTMGKKITVSQTATKHERESAHRSVLAYLAAENSLNPYAMSDLVEMIKGVEDIPEDNNLLVFLDDIKYPRIYEVSRNEIGISDTIRVKSFSEDLDSADPATLEMALNFMKTNYKADEYGLVMWSHGEGWTPGKNATRYIGIDNNQNTQNNFGSMMGIDGLKQAITNSVGYLDLLFFDACFMLTAEVAYELNDCCHYMVGSPCEIPGPGAPYHKVVPHFFADELSRGQIAESYYQYYLNESRHDYGAVISTVDCSVMEDFADTTAKMAAKYFYPGAEILSGDWVQYGFGSVISGYNRKNMYLDIKQVMRETLNGDDYSEWLDIFNKTVLNFCATDFWYSDFSHGNVPLDVTKVGGLAMALPLLITDSRELEDLQQMSWFDRVWK